MIISEDLISQGKLKTPWMNFSPSVDWLRLRYKDGQHSTTTLPVIFQLLILVASFLGFILIQSKYETSDQIEDTIILRWSVIMITVNVQRFRFDI